LIKQLVLGYLIFSILTNFCLPSSSRIPVRTAKAEKRMQDRLRQEGLEAPPVEDIKLSPAKERALQAEKRAAWRAARCGFNFVIYRTLNLW
jgi:hypothetical protein